MNRLSLALSDLIDLVSWFGFLVFFSTKNFINSIAKEVSLMNNWSEVERVHSLANLLEHVGHTFIGEIMTNSCRKTRIVAASHEGEEASLLVIFINDCLSRELSSRHLSSLLFATVEAWCVHISKNFQSNQISRPSLIFTDLWLEDHSLGQTAHAFIQRRCQPPANQGDYGAHVIPFLSWQQSSCSSSSKWLLFGSRQNCLFILQTLQGSTANMGFLSSTVPPHAVFPHLIHGNVNASSFANLSFPRCPFWPC